MLKKTLVLSACLSILSSVASLATEFDRYSWDHSFGSRFGSSSGLSDNEECIIVEAEEGRESNWNDSDFGSSFFREEYVPRNEGTYWWEQVYGVTDENPFQHSEVKKAIEYACKASRATTEEELQDWFGFIYPDGGVATACGLVRAQNKLAEDFGSYEEQDDFLPGNLQGLSEDELMQYASLLSLENGSVNAQSSMVSTHGLSEDELMEYALALSMLDQ